MISVRNYILTTQSFLAALTRFSVFAVILKKKGECILSSDTYVFSDHVSCLTRDPDCGITAQTGLKINNVINNIHFRISKGGGSGSSGPAYEEQFITVDM